MTPAKLPGIDATRYFPKEKPDDRYGAYAPYVKDSSEEIRRNSIAADQALRDSEESKTDRWRRVAGGALSAFGDGLSAMLNLHYTTKGAPDMYAGPRLTAAEDARIQRLTQLREKNKANYEALKDKIDKLKDSDRQWNLQLEVQAAKDRAEKAKADLAAAKDRREQQLHQLNLLLQAGKISEQEAKAREAKINADYAKARNEGELEIQRSTVYRNRAAGNASNATATKNRADVTGRPFYYDKKENIHYVNDWKTAKNHALIEGTWTEDMEEIYEIETQTRGNHTTETERTTQKPYERPSRKPAARYRIK
ncbi:hypothetical protein HDR58_03915 [bacterium]|nr:hypothetical protein [bacterium]